MPIDPLSGVYIKEPEEGITLKVHNPKFMQPRKEKVIYIMNKRGQIHEVTESHFREFGKAREFKQIPPQEYWKLFHIQHPDMPIPKQYSKGMVIIQPLPEVAETPEAIIAKPRRKVKRRKRK